MGDSYVTRMKFFSLHIYIPYVHFLNEEKEKKTLEIFFSANLTENKGNSPN